jgi:hypothetical protein
VGSGQNALQYLSRYVFKTATGNRPLALRPGGQVRWPYRDSSTGQGRTLDLAPGELLRRFLQHVLPSGYHRVRRCGWFHPAARPKLNRVRALLKQSPVFTQAEREAWQPSQETLKTLPPADSQPIPTSPCPHCQKPMVLVGSWRMSQSLLALPRAPP